MSSPAKQSYRDLPPLERGGETARRGFGFQDHVAVHYLLKMLEDPALREVWCDDLDDITLIWDDGSGDEYEFVQVKSNELGEHWSVRDLCERRTRTVDGKKEKVPGSSILERSLANDRGTEPCRFQMVTTCKADKDLELLTLPLTSPDRIMAAGKLPKLLDAVKKYVDGYQSPNSNGPEFWLCKTVWRVWANTDHLKLENMAMVDRFCDRIGEYPAPDLKDGLYARILELAKQAGDASTALGQEHKRISSSQFQTWIRQMALELFHPAARGQGSKLRGKMESAGIPAPQIANATEQRLFYARRRFDSQYLDLRLGEEAELEARSELQRLLIALDSGEAPDNGVAFLALCLQKMENVSSRLSPRGSVSTGYLEGFMYEAADRCAFYFGKRAI